MPDYICRPEKCTGCFACMNVCPKDAIICGVDQYGKTMPEICPDKCVECGLCTKVCPENYLAEKNFPLKCYAAWSKNEKERESCSSGGIATEFSRYIVEQNGVVYGAAFDKKLRVAHMAAETPGELDKFKGSKYVQSYTGMVYREIKEHLKNGKLVLFIGTPCQVAGLKNYLRDKYNNLLLIDLICHGTPPMEYLKEHIAKIAKNRKVTDITFRGKKNSRLTLYSNSKVIYSVRNKQDYYFNAYYKGMISRSNCYQCQYAEPERCSDITIGDFWGLDRSSLINDYSGRISVVLINTENGRRFWENAKDKICFEVRPIEEAVKGNAQLNRPSVCHPERELFLQNYVSGNFNSAVRTPGLKKEMAENRIKDSLPYRTAHKIKKKLRREK